MKYPRLEGFNNTMPVFAAQEYADYVRESRGYKTVWFLGTLTENFRFIIPFTTRKKHGFRDRVFPDSHCCLPMIILILNLRIFF